MTQKVTILGATGSIGVNTLDVIRLHPNQFNVFALTAHKNLELLAEQCLQFNPAYAVITDEIEGVLKAKPLAQDLAAKGCSTEILVGQASLLEVCEAAEVDTVVAAIVGAAGLPPTMAAVRSGKRVLLANKESLVMSGRLFTEEVRKSGGVLLPVDSEHNAIFQCLPTPLTDLDSAGVSKIILTGSGGPFRKLDLHEFEHVNPAQACNHPNWSMGRKISVDSATMMNKGLEFIEACWLFGAQSHQIDVVVHPQSIIHSMVQYRDGSVVAQMGRPDMRTPIAHCLGWPNRMASGVEPLDFTQLSGLDFEAPDFVRFPCLQLAMHVWDMGQDYPAVLNAANEVAVDLFLHERLKFTQIYSVIAGVIESWDSREPESIEDVIQADVRARDQALQLAKRNFNS